MMVELKRNRHHHHHHEGKRPLVMMVKRTSRGQSMVVEHILLSAAALVVLASVSLMFNEVNTSITNMQAEHGLLSIGEQVALGIVKVYEQANSSIARTNITLMLELPERIVGRTYEAHYYFDTNERKHYISVVGANKRVNVEFRKPVGVGISGVIISSTSRKAMIKYTHDESTDNITLGVI